MKSSRSSSRSSLVRFYVATLRDRHIDICHNLRPSPGGGGLCAIRPPVKLDLPPMPGARLLPGGVRRIDGKTYFFIEYQGSLVCVDVGSMQTVTLVPPSGKPTAILPASSGLIVMMGAGHAPMRLVCTDGVWSWRSEAELPTPFAIVRVDADTISAQIPAGKLRGAYDSRSRTLIPADAASLRKEFVGAYRTVGDLAASRRLYFQPVMARCRLRGHDGSVLCVTPPVIIAPAAGLQLTGADFTLSGDGFADYGAVTLTARTFTLALRQCAPLDEEWQRRVKCVELLVSPQLHPLDESLEADFSFGRFTATSGQLSIVIPGINPAIGAAAPGSAFRSRVGALLANIDRALIPVATARYDSATDSWTGAERPYYPSGADTASGLSALRTFLSLPVPDAGSSSSDIAALSPPHCLNATLGASGGDCLLLGGLSATRFAGWLPGEMALTASDSSAALPMACRITFADGSTSVRSGVCLDFTPSTLSPLLVYPAGDAVAMDLYWGRRSLRLPLTPDPSGRFSYWLSDSAAPVSADENMPSFILPASDPAPRRFSGMLAVSSVSAPFAPLAVTRVAGEEAVAVAAAPSQSGSWDAGSARFYLFGPEGTQSLTVNAARSRLTARTLDSRPVEHPEAVCPMGSRGMAVLAGGDLLSISGQRVATLRPFVGAERLGWNPVNEELYCFHSAAFPCPENFTLYEGDTATPLFPDAMVVRPATGDVSSRSCPRPESLAAAPTGLWGIDEEGNIHDYCAEDADARTEVIFRSSVGLTAPVRAIRHVEIPLTGTGIEPGHIELRGDNGAGAAASDALSSWELSGTVTHLSPCRLLMPHRHNIILSVRATVSSILIRQNLA